MDATPATSGSMLPRRDWRTEFDLDDPTFGDEFDDISDDLVRRCPVAKTVDGEYVINRHADVYKVMQDSNVFASSTGIRGSKYQPPPEELLRPNEMDPPEHAWLRASWNPHFTPQAVAAHEPEIRKILNELIDRFIDDGHVDVVKQYADPFSCLAFCRAVAHMPLDDMPYLQKIFHGALAGGTMEDRGENWAKAQQYMANLLEQRAEQPRRDDIVDTILYFEYPNGRPYPLSERAASLTQVTAAGLVTTGAIISGGIRHLAENPPDQKRLRAEPALMTTAIEEFLRVFAAAPCIGRRVTGEVELSGTTLKAGDYVWYNIGGANRDPEVIEDPTRVRLDRSPNQHLTFAAGRHRCLGHNFARMNIRLGIETFLERIPEFSIREDVEPHFQGGMTRRLTGLEVTFAAA